MLIIAILLSLIAGCLNGSYVAFLKKISFPADLVWVIFSLLTFGFAPWIAIILLGDNTLLLLQSISYHTILLLLLGGFSFGFGMILFVFGLKYVGISVSFILNIAVGTLVGSLMPVVLLTPGKLVSNEGIIQIIALIVFLTALFFMMLASKYRETSISEKNTFKGENILGILLGSLSGILTSAQGFVYSYTLPTITQIGHSIGASAITDTLLIWTFIFNAALIPYGLFFLLRYLRSSKDSISHNKLTNTLYIILMAIFYYGSIVVFSKASISLGEIGSVIAWPVLMISIILASNFWGWKQGEWKNAGNRAMTFQKSSIIFLIFAVILLTLAGYFNLK
jgi:L-rhamnose-H+ transport protein